MLSELKYKHLMVWEKGIGCFFCCNRKSDFTDEDFISIAVLYKFRGRRNY